MMHVPVFPIPMRQAMHQTLINEKHYIKIKIQQLTKEGERENFYFNPPNRLCRNEFMEVCKLSFWMWCKCEHVMSRTGWRLAKYIAMRRRMNDLVKNIGKESAHGAQLGLLRRCRIESTTCSRNAVESASGVFFSLPPHVYDFHLVQTHMKHVQAISISSSVTNVS